jgi:DNA-binding XRE family transcriptional regulator
MRESIFLWTGLKKQMNGNTMNSKGAIAMKSCILKEDTRLTLKAARQRMGLTQAHAAQLIGVSTNTLSNYETARSYPDVPVLQQIERVYGVRYDQLAFLPRRY